MLASEVIQQLNEAHGGPAFNFPHFSVFFPVDARLSVYRSQTGWALIIETLVFNDGLSEHDCCTTMQFCYGNELPQAPGVVQPGLVVTGDGPSAPLFDPDDVMGHLIAPSASDMTIRGKVVPITTDPSKYAAAWIELRQQPRIVGYELLRLIAPQYRRSFFATEREIVVLVGEEMPLLLRLDEWRHPDRDEGETPADSESFQMIADAIAANDPKLYQPTEPPNTHWRNWPMAGML